MDRLPELPTPRSEKIGDGHLERLAVVYVRQSTVQQMMDHRESTNLQYGLVGRAIAMGWPEGRVLVIDEDLGKSGASAEGREGFARLVAEVGLDHVGLILGVEMSRLARSSKDWHQLLEICALFGTLIADLDGVYDPSQYNDRLLLGLKGTMSEAELHVLKQRLHEGKLSKARRGELAFALPVGYARKPSGEVVLDPDEQVRQVVRLVFRKFEELGTLHALLRYLVSNGIHLGVRVREGAGKGELRWRKPNRMTLQNMLKNPIYAGVYAYGKRQVDPRKKRPGKPSTGRVVLDRGRWHAFIEESFPAYISLEQYETNLRRLAANRARAEERGAVRHGPSLLQGLLICGKCAHRMQVRYGGANKLHTYTCSRLATDYAEGYCHYLPGAPLDEFVGGWVLKALEPAALELSLEASEYLEKEREELDGLWRKRLERASYEAERAGRHYRLIEPENRLVARQLAREWEEKLEAQRQLQEDYRRFVAEQPRPLSEAERENIRRLAKDIPALWHSPQTTTAERKEIVRQIVERVVVENEGNSERLRVSIEWVGGSETEGVVIRPVSKMERLSYYPELCERVRELVAQEMSTKEIAETLNREGYRPPKQAGRLGRQAVTEVLQRLGLRPVRRRGPRDFGAGGPAEDEWWLAELARVLRMPGGTLHGWIGRGWVEARKQESSGRWIVQADEAEVERLRQLRSLPMGHYDHHGWLDYASRRMATRGSMPDNE
ncbi:MAG TPA: recombinase family protein [Rubrobacter sp.]|nr:recombinase family protein [Rubrobacter sp.]